MAAALSLIKTKHRFPKEAPEYVLHTLIDDMSSETYHGIAGTHSSSQLKDLLDDPSIFIRKYIEKSIEREDVPAFSVGNYFHTGVLEPDKLLTECAVYPGKVRRGKDWDRFELKNKGKVLLTSSMKEQAEQLITLVQDSPVAMGFISRGTPEVSLFTEIWVYGGEVFAPKYDKMLDVEVGWIDYNCSDIIDPKKVVKFVIKVRADSLGDDFILDLKSTTGNAHSERSMRGKISYYQYDLSAALYLDMFSLQQLRNRFIWTFASKDCFNCKSYAASPTNIKVGRAKYRKALVTMAELKRNNYQLYDYLGILEPENYELEILREKDTDLI